MQAVEGAPLPPLAEGEVSSFANWIKLLHSKGSEACPQNLHGLMLLYLVCGFASSKHTPCGGLLQVLPLAEVELHQVSYIAVSRPQQIQAIKAEDHNVIEVQMASGPAPLCRCIESS